MTLLLMALMLVLFTFQMCNVSRANPDIFDPPTPPPKPTMTPPIISILSPENNTVHCANSVVLAFNVNVPDSGISADKPYWWVHYTADWGQCPILVYKQTAGDNRFPRFKDFSINLTDVPDGNHSIQINAKRLIILEGFHYEEESQTSVSFTIDSTPPRISGISIENKTYSSTEQPLTFTVNETISQASYSLDNQANVTINGNTTIQGLTEGTHNLIVYATDPAGNTGASEMITFSVATPVSTTVAATAVVFTVVVVASLLVYFRKGANRLGRDSAKPKLP